MKEEVKRYLIEDISSESVKRLAKKDVTASKLAETLWEITLDNIHPYSWRAAWFLQHIILENRHLANFYAPLFLKNINNFNHPGQVRHGLIIVLLSDEKDWDDGFLLNLCFDYMISESQPPAIRVYSMEIVQRVVNRLPELKREFKETLELISKEGKPSILGRVKYHLDILNGRKSSKQKRLY